MATKVDFACKWSPLGGDTMVPRAPCPSINSHYRPLLSPWAFSSRRLVRPLLAGAGPLWSGSVVGGSFRRFASALLLLSCGGCHLLLCDRSLVAAATSACVCGGCHLRSARTTSTGPQAVVSCALLSRVQVRLARTTCRGYQVRRRSSTTQAGTGAAQARRTTSWRPQVAFRSDAFSCVSLSRAQVR